MLASLSLDWLDKWRQRGIYSTQFFLVMLPEQELPECQSYPDAQPAFQPPYTSHDTLFAAMKPRELISFGGPRGVLALRAQFQGTLFAGAFENLANETQEDMEVMAGEEPAQPIAGVYAAHVQQRIENLLREKKGGLETTGSRVIDERGEEITAGLSLMATANQVRRTVARLVPELDTPSLEDIDVGFTPVLNDRKQLIFAEGITGDFPEGWDEQSPNSLVFSEDQYTLFEQQEDGNWQCRGTLAFIRCAEFEQTPYSYMTDDQLAEWHVKTSMVVGRDADGLNIVYEADPTRRDDEQTRASTILLDTPYPHEHFDEDWNGEDNWIVETLADVEIDMDVGRVIFAPFPPGVSLPPASG